MENKQDYKEQKTFKGLITNPWDVLSLQTKDQTISMDELLKNINLFLDDHTGHKVKIKICIYDKEEEQDVEDEPTVNFTLEQINNFGVWEQFIEWKDWDFYAGHRISAMGDWNERQEIPISIAKKWGLI